MTLLELLVAIGVVVILAAIAFPVVSKIRQNGLKTNSLEKMRQIGTAFILYTSENNGHLPMEDAPGKDDWHLVTQPEARDTWYNALPPLAGGRAVADYASTPERFFEKENVLYLQAAKYPRGPKLIAEPRFAFAMNSRLQRRDEDGIKRPGRLQNVVEPSRTIAFLESGLDGEDPAREGISRFDGSPKANPKDFVTRYGRQGLLIFLDGHVELVSVEEIMTPTGLIPTPQEEYIWTMDPQDDPN
jgi:hypothetical protein